MLKFSAALLCLSALLLSSCAPKVAPHKSALLDGAKATFLGAADQKEYPGKVVVWDAEHLLISGRRKAPDAPKGAPFTHFLWLAQPDGRILWEKTFDSLEIFDLAMLDSAKTLVLANPPRELRGSVFSLFTVDRAGNIADRSFHRAPEGMWAARLTWLAADSLLVTAWKRSADSSELVCQALHVDARGESHAGTWAYPAQQLFPLRDGGFLAQRERAVTKDRDALAELARLRVDGSIVWKRKDPLGEVKAELRGMAETADGALLLTGVGKNLYDPILAKLDARGQLLWVKQPPEMVDCQLYNLVPWGKDHFLVVAQKPLTEKGLSRTVWDSFAAIVIDAEGVVIDYDMLPEHWTFPVGGIVRAGLTRYYVSGIGGADPKQQMKQTDIALYELEAPR